MQLFRKYPDSDHFARSLHLFKDKIIKFTEIIKHIPDL